MVFHFPARADDLLGGSFLGLFQKMMQQDEAAILIEIKIKHAVSAGPELPNVAVDVLGELGIFTQQRATPLF